MGPQGRTYLLDGTWLTVSALGARKPGTLLSLSVAFRHHLLQQGMQDLVAGRDLALATSRLLELGKHAHVANHAHDHWWALATMVPMHWRQGQLREARSKLVQAERLCPKRDLLQESLYAALRAQQALLDGDHALCWLALQRASCCYARLPPAHPVFAPALDE